MENGMKFITGTLYGGTARFLNVKVVYMLVLVCRASTVV
jgi:hypothetical protein